ncbi:hypothetical protein [Effusibacillus consociatus]|uniref:Uncharacterized protein n=1 Tax=Effusibacillus consociatus TaxID=1117041 RepID=A0ABV9Q6N4_9BACL
MQRVTEWMRGGDITTFFWVNHAWKSSFSDRFMPLITNLGGAV